MEFFALHVAARPARRGARFNGSAWFSFPTGNTRCSRRLRGSSTNLDLSPVVEGLRREYHLSAVEVEQSGVSDWILLCANPKILSVADKYSEALETSKSIPVWTDDYSNLFQVLRQQ